MAGAFAILAAAVVGLWFIYLGARAPGPGPAAANFPAPRLDTQEELHRLQAQGAERRELRSYGWVDRKAGLARIPIDEAMTIIAGRGAAAFGPLPSPTGGNAGAPMPPGGGGR
jgi:hypothetical protein